MLNKAILMGRLVADPELRRTPNNNSVTSFTLAVNRSFVRQGEQPQTDFIDIVAWGKTAEFVSRYFVKGQLVAVEQHGAAAQLAVCLLYTSPSPRDRG